MDASTPIPSASAALPALGHLIPLVRRPLDFLSSLPGQGDLVQIRVGPVKLVVVCDPELTRQVLRDPRTFDKGGIVYERAREVLGNGLASCPHSDHRRQRLLTQPSFHHARLPGYAQIMAAHIADVTDSWRDGQVVDVPRAMLTFSSQVMTAAMFSDEQPAQVLIQMHDDVYSIIDGVLRRALTPRSLNRLPTRGNRSYLRACSRLRRSIADIIAKRRTDTTDRGDVLSALLAAENPEDGRRGLSDAELADTVLSLFLAGVETTAAALSWALHLVSLHPEIERRLHAEVDAVLASRPAVHADLSDLDLTGRVVKETLRLRSPGWLFTRTVTADTRLGGYALPAGTMIAYSPYLIHHRDDLYDAPETFDPDRWTGDRPYAGRHDLIPFGGGARKCIGDTFAVTEVTLALATITARWRLRTLDGQDVRPVSSVVLRPRELRMRATARGES
jgi:cytochrome P450